MTESAPKSSGYASSHSVVRLSSKRYTFSPYAPCYARPDTVWGLYSGRFYALGWGDDALATYRSLRRDAVLYDVPERPIEIAGRDALALLQRTLCRKIADLGIGRGRYGIACRDDGGILMDGVLFRLAEQRYWYVPANGEFLPWLHALAIGLEVRISDPASFVVQVQGPRSFEVLAAVWDAAAARELPYFHIRPCTIAGQRFLVSRTGWTGELGFELYTLESEPDGPGLWSHLLDKGRPYGLVAGSLESMGIRRIEAGILDNGTDMDPSLTPYQAGLGKFVDLEASDFVGRAALRKADKRSLLHGISCQQKVPVAGMVVRYGGRSVGRITTGAWSPTLECGVGYARLEGPDPGPGSEVELGSTEAGFAAARLVDLPFIDAERRLPRGLAG